MDFLGQAIPNVPCTCPGRHWEREVDGWSTVLVAVMGRGADTAAPMPRAMASKRGHDHTDARPLPCRFEAAGPAIRLAGVAPRRDKREARLPVPLAELDRAAGDRPSWQALGRGGETP